MLVLEEFHVTALSVASAGVIVAVSDPVLPLSITSADLSSDTPVTGTVTVTVQLAVYPPSAVFTLIVPVPPPTAVTTPEASTVATSVLLEDQLTALLVASAGETVADKVTV